MRYFFFTALLFVSVTAFSQPNFTATNLSLPSELSYYDNQFSGLAVHDGKLFLMSESRLEDLAEPKLYAINLSDLDHKIADSNFVLPYRKYHIYNMDLLRQKMKEKGDDYEGLEAIVMKGDDVYLSVETATPSDNCYLLKGHLNYSDVVMDPEVMITMKKPVNRNGSHIYNAGFEAVAMSDDNFCPFFEYNYFPQENYVRMVSANSFEKGGESHPIFTDRIPFRVTDITANGTDRYTAINYFYKGGGDDAVYRLPANETSGNRLIKDSTGNYRSYCRLLDISFNGTTFTWKTLWEFPEAYWGYNWEGIALYKEGYFIMNDKYTPSKPYLSTLLYLKKQN